MPASRVARWNGAAWSALGSGLDGLVLALRSHDQDGPGPGASVLVAAGTFLAAGGSAANRITRWDGVGWAPFGAGMDGPVTTLCSFDDGQGPALFAGGLFSIAGVVPANNVARWNGSTWKALGSGVNGQVDALAVFDDGTGPALYAAGLFSKAGGIDASNVARWNGSGWSPLGSGVDASVQSLCVFDDGSGRGAALFAGGQFMLAGGASASHVARWDGVEWTELDGGTNLRVITLAVFDDPSAPAPSLYVGGRFTSSGGEAASHLARWTGCNAFAYCTAKSNSCGALPSISSSGYASASQSSGFVIETTGARPGKYGLLLYGADGPSSAPFSGGTLCIAAPVRRGPITAAVGGTTGANCDARFSIDWNAFASGALGGNPQAYLTASGQRVNVQWWGRDSLTSGSLLSDAIEYLVRP
jgi:hypothetical protein